jgi:hypothetical protein
MNNEIWERGCLEDGGDWRMTLIFVLGGLVLNVNRTDSIVLRCAVWYLQYLRCITRQLDVCLLSLQTPRKPLINRPQNYIIASKLEPTVTRAGRGQACELILSCNSCGTGDCSTLLFIVPT